jgi:hypothetical protein
LDGAFETQTLRGTERLVHWRAGKVVRQKITLFYAWQSDQPSKVNRHFIRRALDDAARRLTEDQSLGADVIVDADTEGVVGTPPVTETILQKIGKADIFVPDLTFTAETKSGKLVPNPNVMVEYGYALHALTYEAMMPVMNAHFGVPEDLPFDLGHVRHPTQYNVPPDAPDGERRAARAKLSAKLEDILRLMIKSALNKVRSKNPFVPKSPERAPAFFFQPGDVLANFGNPGEQELRFKRDRAIYLRLYPAYADQPRIGLTRAIEIAQRVMPLQRVISSLSTRNDWGAISLQPHGDGITSFSQIFETGELWGVSEEPFKSGERPFVAAIGVERAFVAALNNYRIVCESDLKLRPPFTVEFGATGLKDRYLLVPSAEFPSTGDYAGPILTDSVYRNFELTSFDIAEWMAALREFLIELYDLTARDRSKVLTEQIIAAHELPVR